MIIESFHTLPNVCMTELTESLIRHVMPCLEADQVSYTRWEFYRLPCTIYRPKSSSFPLLGFVCPGTSHHITLQSIACSFP